MTSTEFDGPSTVNEAQIRTEEKPMSQASPAAVTQPTVRPLVSMKGISKNFGAIRALTSVDLEVYPGEVVALVGDNGAGKSTLVKILAGVFKPDAGSIGLGGTPVIIGNTAEAYELGIAPVFQDLAL